MTSKKFNSHWNLQNFLLLILLFGLPLNLRAQNAVRPSIQIPVLHYAGVIPVQWDKDEVWQDLSQVKKTIDVDFSTAVHGSRRFSMINDDLVKSLWKTPTGRKELENDYELSVYANLDVSARGDMVVLTTRLLSPTLETKLQESDVIPRKWLLDSTREQITNRLVDLVQRMINRLPVDAHITSVNGNYVTLSAGTEQGVKVGDSFETLSAKISGLHPANGSWISFSTSKTGTIEVVEIKARSSIAKIASLVSDNSIKPKDGVRIGDISSRNRFARTEEKQSSPPPSSSESAILTPIPTTKEAPPVAVTPVAPVKVYDAKTVESEKKPQDAGTAETGTETKTEKSPGPEPETDNFTATLMPKGSELRAWLGMKMWSIGGSASASSALPLWIVNSMGADVYRKFTDTIDFNYGLDLGYGPTAKGSFFGYNLHSGGRWHMNLKNILPGADDAFVGLLASLASTSISGETSGGFDMTLMRLAFGVHGWAKPGFVGDKVEWTGEFFYPLYRSGRFGVKGKFKNIESGSSLAFRIGGYLGDRPKEGWQYGAGFDYESSRWDLSSKKSAEYSSIGILALARRSL